MYCVGKCLEKNIKKGKLDKMNFVIDIGNSNIVLGLYKIDELSSLWRIETVKSESIDSYYHKIQSLFTNDQISIPQISCIALSSVVSELTEIFTNLFERFFDCPHIIVNAYSKLGLSFPVSDPGFIGPDLIVNSYAAWQKYKTNCIICDFGTATTFQLVDVNGFHHGSIIVPGVHISAKALFSQASQLPNVEITEPVNLLGTNTKDSLLSGIVTGNKIMADGFIRKIRLQYQHLGDITTIATGGITELICKNSKEIDIIDNNLQLDGLNLICRKINFK